MKKSGKVGIRDLAAHMGLAVSTVSRAMNGTRDVNEETRKRILLEAERLGYQPNQSGRSLRSGTTNVIAMTIRTDTGRTASGETFFMALSDGLQSVLARAGYDLALLPCASDQDENEFLYRAVDRKFADAFIITNVQRFDQRIDYLRRVDMPFVVLGRSDIRSDYAALDLDFSGVAKQAVRRLIEQGRKLIVLGLTAQETNNNYLFLSGYQEALREAGLPFDDKLVLRLYDRISGGSELGGAILDMPERPTGALLIQETMAMGLYQRLYKAGLEPGKDLAVIGFRENPVCRYLSPSLTCFHVDIKKYGERLGEMVLGEIKRETLNAEKLQEVWPMDLIPGNSG
ncbi:substrate-binding domain-containing protein [Ensifer adhaerens]|uniref:LacI family DNA-binding transcriptional regulator n=1 Tax=Ensifer adhaerens TaxID=106592 RepID=UPI001CBE56D3|nr:substrate-binding domain-containing protein [Ensifer adhaerens]MBZ7924886.1 substrate-binding domain-containing protein [Ensifer adhaerens]UAX95899.1 substrate-binding domain-containing protein [Ensifer adhaerens]UAY04759.1 substrate-binding domain-containing protein [Ensifer adhaerens]UAY10190.1 substrate-binding domain-containing protein [Ensifer adhaerens]